MVSRSLILGCLAVLVSACTIPQSLSPCPMGDAYEYLSCADPDFSWGREAADPQEREEELRIFSELMENYCSDEPAAYLPVLDRNAKKSTPAARKLIRDRLKAADGETLNEKNFRLPQEDHDKLETEFKSLANKRIHSYVVGLYVLSAALPGRNDQFADSQRCAIYFEKVRLSGAVEEDVQDRFFSEYEWYFFIP